MQELNKLTLLHGLVFANVQVVFKRRPEFMSGGGSGGGEDYEDGHGRGHDRYAGNGFSLGDQALEDGGGWGDSYDDNGSGDGWTDE